MDLILAMGDGSTDLLLEHGKELFGDIPVVLINTKQKKKSPDLLKPNMISLKWGFDFIDTAYLIQKVLPETKKIYIISGVSRTDRELKISATEELAGYNGQMTFQYLDDLSIEELLLKVTQLPEDSAIFYLSILRDNNGKTFIPRDILSDISEKADVPTFGIVDTYLGHGIVGGHLLSAANMDRRSFDLDYENNILFYDRSLIADMRQRQKSYIARSRPVTGQMVDRWTWRRRIWNNAIAMFGPVL